MENSTKRDDLEVHPFQETSSHMFGGFQLEVAEVESMASSK